MLTTVEDQANFRPGRNRRLDDDISATILPSPRACKSNVEDEHNIAGSLDTILDTYNFDNATSVEENKTEVKSIETDNGNETILLNEFLRNWTPVLSVAPANLQLRAPAQTAQLTGPVPSPIVNVVLPTQSNSPTLAAAVNTAATGTLQGFASTPNVSQTTTQPNPPSVASYGYVPSLHIDSGPKTLSVHWRRIRTIYCYTLREPSSSLGKAETDFFHYSVQRAMVASTPTMMLPIQMNNTFQPTLTQVGVPLTSPSTFPTALASVASTSNANPSLPYTHAPAIPTQPFSDFTCRWLVPGGICGANERDREKLVDHIKEKHEFIRKVDSKNPAITRRGCCWEGCGVVLSPSTNLKAHLRTHLKVKDHLPSSHEDHYQGRASCKGTRWSPYQKGH